MKEEILKIIVKNIGTENPSTNSSEEITSHVMEFIHWLSFGSHPWVTWVDEYGVYYTDEITDKRWTIEELYELWLTKYREQ